MNPPNIPIEIFVLCICGLCVFAVISALWIAYKR